MPLGSTDADNHVRMAHLGEQAQFVIENDRSWDDLHLGYWCEFDRLPDDYNLEFWRLLHAPLEARGDIEGLRDILGSLLADQDLRTALRRRSAERLMRFTPDRVVSTIEFQYRSLR